MTHVDGNLSGVDFNLVDSDHDGDGFTNWQEYLGGNEFKRCQFHARARFRTGRMDIGHLTATPPICRAMEIMEQ